MINVRFDLDGTGLQTFAARLSEASMLLAARRAARKTAAWLRVHAARAAGDELKMPKRVLASRVQMYDKGWRQGGTGQVAFKVWFGIDPIEADRLGRPKAMPKGYRVGRYRFMDAFMPRRGRFANKLYRRTTDARLPIQRIKVEIDAVGRRVMERLASAAEVRFADLLQHELHYEVLKLDGVVEARSTRRAK